MIHLLLIAAAGVIGILSRYAISLATVYYFGTQFPWGTLFVNLFGSFLFGLFWQFATVKDISPMIRNIITIGLLGGFTTFSSFAFETLQLFYGGNIKYGIYNITANVIGGIGLVMLGAMVVSYK